MVDAVVLTPLRVLPHSRVTARLGRGLVTEVHGRWVKHRHCLLLTNRANLGERLSVHLGHTDEALGVLVIIVLVTLELVIDLRVLAVPKLVNVISVTGQVVHLLRLVGVLQVLLHQGGGLGLVLGHLADSNAADSERVAVLGTREEHTDAEPQPLIAGRTEEGLDLAILGGKAGLAVALPQDVLAAAVVHPRAGGAGLGVQHAGHSNSVFHARDQANVVLAHTRSGGILLVGDLEIALAHLGGDLLVASPGLGAGLEHAVGKNVVARLLLSSSRTLDSLGVGRVALLGRGVRLERLLGHFVSVSGVRVKRCREILLARGLRLPLLLLGLELLVAQDALLLALDLEEVLPGLLLLLLDLLHVLGIGLVLALDALGAIVRVVSSNQLLLLVLESITGLGKH
mmetsp:Transcript_17757/g.41763  ORF Transcript_17757/g.41763 Transcript_17757/m.41763 type:complete len:399 (+) Transcript_17757:111-1307(+)